MVSPLNGRLSEIRTKSKSLNPSNGTSMESIAEYRKRPAIGREPAEIWVCSEHQVGHDLIGDLAKADASSHAFVFTDLENEMLLGPGRHRIEQ
jgi:hypothetical protein